MRNLLSIRMHNVVYDDRRVHNCVCYLCVIGAVIDDNFLSGEIRRVNRNLIEKKSEEMDRWKSKYE